MILLYHFILRPVLPLSEWEEFTISHIGRLTQIHKSNESGQAFVEYILIIAVVLLIVLGAAYQFNSSFKVFVTNYFGNYTACLLETGELPGLFSAGNGGGQCDAEFKQFNANDGAPLVTAGGGGPGGGTPPGGGGAGANETSRTERNRNEQRQGAKNSRSEGEGSAAAGGGGGGFGSINKVGNQKSKATRRVVGSLADGNTYTGSTDPSSKKGRFVAQLSTTDSRGQKMTLDRRFVADDGSGNDREPPLKTDVPSDESTQVRSKKLKFELRKPAAKKDDSDEEGFSIQGLLRLLLIAAIAIALFVVISGQAASISKSWEKE